MIIGRAKEQKLLAKVFQSKEAEFVTIYGRRRVGKTFLIREFFSSKECTFFHVTGLQNGNMQKQLLKFSEAFSHTFYSNALLLPPRNWNEAFGSLNKLIPTIDNKVVIFLDELPWLATDKSGLLTELDYYWNRHWSSMRNVILVVCGSSASWLLKKIIYNKGGLHNRTTCQIELLPFSLYETDEYLKSRNIKLDQRHVLKLYMALGGIPYYLKYIEKGITAEQNIQHLFFDKQAPLKDEFTKLFDSLFDGADTYKELMRIIAKKKNGIARANLVSDVKLTGGRLTERLKDLSATGFIEQFIPFGQTKGEYYKVIDEFCLFYLHWLDEHMGKFPAHYWMNQCQQPSYYSWAGYAFEAICRKHIDLIIQALGIHAALTISSWRSVPPKKSIEKGTQIDLVVDRSDNAINLCEIKYTQEPFALDKQCAEKLQHAVKIFKQKTGIEKQIFLSLISAQGIKETLYSQELISSVATLSDLFKAQ